MGGVVDKVTNMFGEAFEGKDAAPIRQASFNQTSDTGFTSSLDAEGNVVSGMSPEMLGLFEQGVGQAGEFAGEVRGAGAQAAELGAGFLGQAGTFDPFAAAEEQFSRLDAILEPGRQRTREGTSSGLLATGRLGGSAGNLVQAQVEGEIENQRAQMLNQQFTAAQDTQDRLVQRGTGLGAFGLQQQAGTQQLGQGALQGALAIDSQRQANLGMGSQVSGAIGSEQSELAPVHQAGIGFLSNI